MSVADRSRRPRGRLTAQLIGNPQFFVDGQECNIRLRNSKALLAYLCLNVGTRIARTRLASLLWDTDDEAKASGSLRATLYSLRGDLANHGYGEIVTTKSYILLPHGAVGTDIDDVLDALVEGADCPDALTAHPQLSGTLCDGLDAATEEYAAFLRAQRQILQSRLLGHLEALLERDTEPRSRLRYAEALAAQDPSNELACRTIMRARAAEGDHAGAVKAYNSLYDHLADEFDSEPTPETVSLLAQIKLDQFTPDFIPAVVSQPVATTPLPGDARDGVTLSMGPTLVVAAFAAVSVNESRYDIANIFRQDLISRLIRFREWSVLDDPEGTYSPNGNAAFKLDGQIVQGTEVSRLTLNLKDLRDDRFVWSEFFDLGVDEVLDKQAEMVGRIALALNIHLSADRLERVAAIPNVTLDLYDRLLIGQKLNFNWTMADSEKAADIFRSIIEDHPFFSPAYSALAQLINSRHIMFPGAFRQSNLLDFSEHLSRIAMRLDPLDSRAHLCGGWAYALKDEFIEAYHGFQTAFDLNQNDPWTAVSAPAGFCFCGDLERAQHLIERAGSMGLVASPLQWSYNVVIWFSCGRPDLAIAAFDKAAGGFFGVEAWYTAALVHNGQKQKARAQFRSLLQNIRHKWTMPDAPSDREIEKWLVQCFPIGDKTVKDRFFNALSDAGMGKNQA